MIPEVNPYNNYKGDGVATKFDFDFYIQNPNQLIVEKISSNNIVTPLVNEVDYTIKQFEGEIGGYIEYPINSSMHEVLQDDETISLQLNLAFEQQSEYGQSSLLDLNSIEFSLDYLTRLCQILKRKLELCVKVEEGSNISPDELFDSINVSKEECILNAQAANTSAINAAIEAKESKANADKSKQYANKAEELNVSLTENFEDYQEELLSDKEEYKEEINIAKNSAIAEVNNSGLASRANLDLSNLSTQGQAKFDVKANKVDVLNKSQITNCILEVPQKINLTLDSGTLILKKGSKVTVPNGTGVFNEITLTADMNIISGNLKRTLMIFYRNGSYQRCETRFAFSGATAPTSSSSIMLWYDTTNNLVKFTNDGGTTWVSDNISLPFCIVKESNSGWASIDEVFNGFGYIGSTVWADKNAKYLISNGRNIDGTLNNIEYVFPETRTQTRTDKYTGNVLLAYSQNGNVAWWTKEYYTESDVAPIVTSATWRWLNTKENKMYYTTDNGATWKTATYAILGEVSFAEGKITGFYSKNTFRAVDYNDFVNTPRVVETYKNSTSWYRVYSDGWIEQGGKSATPATITLLKPYSDTNYTVQISATEPHNGANYQNIAASSLTTTGFAVTFSGNNQYVAGIYWSTCGY